MFGSQCWHRSPECEQQETQCVSDFEVDLPRDAHHQHLKEAALWHSELKDGPKPPTGSLSGSRLEVDPAVSWCCVNKMRSAETQERRDTCFGPPRHHCSTLRRRCRSSSQAPHHITNKQCQPSQQGIRDRRLSGIRNMKESRRVLIDCGSAARNPSAPGTRLNKHV